MGISYVIPLSLWLFGHRTICQSTFVSEEASVENVLIL